jgi:hypothetical protein
MDEDHGDLAYIPVGDGSTLVIGWHRNMIVVGERYLEIADTATLEIALDEAVAQARAWADGHAGE